MKLQSSPPKESGAEALMWAKSLPLDVLGCFEKVLRWGPREFWFENHRKCFFPSFKKIQSFYTMTTQAYARFALITYFCTERQITHSVEWKGTSAFLCVWKYLQETGIGNCSLFSIPGQCSRVESLRCAFWCCLIKELAISNVILKGERSSGWGLALT